MRNIKTKRNQGPFIVVLGIAQDGGIPHTGCLKKCCREVWKKLTKQKLVSCMGIVDPTTKQCWLIDATPDLKHQLFTIQKLLPEKTKPFVDGIFLTHAHIGHFTGLIQFEKAVLNASNLPVFAMPKMKMLLKGSQPWKKMVNNHNIKIVSLKDGLFVKLNERIKIKPVLVPHRDEYSETVGFIIAGPTKKILYIPDIDSWSEFPKIDLLIKDVDISFLDGTFFDNHELPGRNIKDIPHPTIKTSITRFKKDSKKIFFIHLNHSNPVVFRKGKEYTRLIKSGFNIAAEKQIVRI